LAGLTRPGSSREARFFGPTLTPHYAMVLAIRSPRLLSRVRCLWRECTIVHIRDGRDAAFEWDEAKARANLRKHGVDFADVTPVLEDGRAVTVKDVITAVDEQRYVTIGSDALRRILVVAYTWRGSRIRIVSARRASAAERRQYRGKLR
jgi:uncharacterized DUF497 family protein